MNRRRIAMLIALFAVRCLVPVPSSYVKAQSRNVPTGANITGRIIVPIADFEDIFEILLVQNLEQTIQATVVDSLGRFRFSNVPRGTYYIVVKLEGFQDVRYRVDLVADTVANIILDFAEERIIKPRTDFSGEDAGIVDTAELAHSYPARVIDDLKAAEKDLESSNYTKALPILEELVRDQPDFYQAQKMLGTVYQKFGRYRDAESAYKTAVELRPLSAAPLINLGSLYVEEAQANENKGTAVVRGILNESLASLSAAIKLKSDAPFAYYLLGVTYYKSAFYEDAEDHLKHAIALAPDLYDARLALSNVYLKMQEWSNAIAQLDAYLATYPKSPIRDQVESMRSKVVARSQARAR